MKSGGRLSRRTFVAAATAGAGALSANIPELLAAQPTRPGGARARRDWRTRQELDYDATIKLNFNENPWGPSDSVVEAMTYAFKYANRYGYPDGGIHQAIADHHGVDRDHVLLGAGSGEILEVVGLTFLADGKKVVGSEPSYGQVYSHASGIDAEAVTIPLLNDYSQDVPGLIDTANAHADQVGFVYLCNPNNPTGRIVPAAEVEQLLAGIPEGIPVLIDEAYHHFVEDPSYETALPHVLAGRQVIVARTFSKIYGMAAMRLGYALAPPAIIQQMRPWSTGSVNALARWGGAAALEDHAAQERVRETTLTLRKNTTSELERMGFEVIPSDTNFFMVRTGRPVGELSPEFRKRGIRVGRPFPPMLDHLRVSVGKEADMARFLEAWKDIFAHG